MSSVDVFVPCYRYGHFLRECVESVLSQSDVNIRVLIIDDASPDNTAEVATDLVNEDSRVTYVRHSANKGHIATYNEGIEWASANYSLLLSADDLLVPGALQRAAKVMDENPDIVLTHGKFIEWDDRLPLPEVHQPPTFVWRRQELIREICNEAANLVSVPTAIVRTSVQKAIGGYRQSLPHTGDMEMWLRFAAHGPIAKIEDAVQGIYRRHSSNMSDPYCSAKLSDFRERKKAFDTFFDEYGYRVPEAGSLRAKADLTLSNKAYISGVAKLWRGQIKDGYNLLWYSMRLNPRLRFRPPIIWIVKNADIGRRA